MDNKSWGLLAVLAGIAAWIYSKQSDAPATAADSAVTFGSDPLASVSDVITSSVAGWKSVGDGPLWIDALNAAESQHGIPIDLLARLAYQESHFRHEIITGAKASPAGALGLMQMMPQYYDSVRVARPFTPDATQAQINQAAQTLAGHFSTFNSWPLALAAYNAGAGAVHKYSGIPPFTETQNYVQQIMADVPAVA
jgi:soluble lytic murein transglycosylase-like protein